MIQDPTTAVFGSYNARSESAEVVADGFVAPPQFWNVLPLGNTVLTGPRGSGKTTLLKMLTAPGLETWDDPRAEEATALANYSGVFVPADRSWAGQVEVIGRQLDDRLRVELATASFVLHSLRSLVECARWRTRTEGALRAHHRVRLDPGVEEEIARAVYKDWGLQQPAGSLYGLQIGLRGEISALGKLARRATRAERPDDLRDHPALNLELIDAVLPFIERFNHAARHEDHVWAFLIDEIEFLPQGIQIMLINSMRGRDPRIVQKVTIAPYTTTSTEQLNTPLGGWEGHDFQRVDLTFTEKEQGYTFSRHLVAREIEQSKDASRRRLPHVHDLLGGEGFFERPPGKNAYGAGSANATAIKALATQDKSFAAWLQTREIDAEDLKGVTGIKRSGTIQKAIAIILLRREFLHLVRGKLKGRSRKRPTIYVGEEAIFAICENNPRLLKALVGKLLALHHGGKLKKGTRADAIEECCRAYHLHLRAIEVEKSIEDALLPRRLIDSVGNAFATGIYGEDFDPEPPLAFDVKTKDSMRAGLPGVLSQLTHYGAIIPIGENSYRLAHMFAPIYRLPLRKGRSRALSSILNSQRHVEQLEIDEQHSE